MPHNLDLILTLTGGLTAALMFGLFTQALRLSPIVGYLLAGIVVGPFTPGFIAHADIAEQLAELGVILLMFGVGLHFHLHELLAVKHIAIPGAIVQITLATLLGIGLTRWAGMSMSAGLVFGLAVSVASTVVLLRMLTDSNRLHTHAGHVAVGWLVVEDIFTVFVLVILPVLVRPGLSQSGADIGMALVAATLKVGALVAFTAIVGKRVIPKLLEHVALTRSRELFTLTVLVIALGIALGSAKLFGVSMALGAFLAGMVVAQSDFSSRAASEALPMRDAFAVLFFVSMGMLFDPARLMSDIGLTLGTVAIVLLAKPLAALAVMLLMKRPMRVALVVAVALSQIGEFSFMLATVGRQLGVLPPEATQVLVISAIVSITLNSFLFRGIEPLLQWLGGRKLSGHSMAPPEMLAAHSGDEPSTIVVGYGPVGRMVTRLLRENHIEVVVIELNYQTVQLLHSQRVRAVHGDAANSEILLQAGMQHARSLIFTASGTPPEAVIRMAKELNPDAIVLARSAYVAEAEQLRNAGAHIIVTAEAEVALAMTERVLVGLGATPEQLDRERSRVRRSLFPVVTGSKPVENI
ncbi:MAG TPA: cation:proton antiporter [Polyangiales bacterium]|nr:cation:proton antiporter [Polyangiales bacterium]